MGLFSKVKNVVSKGANLAFNPSSWVSTAKDVAGSSVGKLGMEALGTYFGYPGLGTAIGGMLGGGTNPATNQPYGWADLLSAGLSGYSAKEQAENVRKQELGDYERFYQDNLALADRQSASAHDLAQWQNIWSRENASQAQEWTQDNMAFANEMNQTNAKDQMAWQAHMSNTAHQREVMDLRAAGLNPLLSGTGGMGASASGGASGSVGNPAGPQASTPAPQVTQLGNIVTSAFGAMKAMADATNTTAQTNFLQGAQTSKTKADTELSKSTTDLNVIRGRLNQDQSLKIASEIQNLKAIRENIPLSGKLTQAQTSNLNQTTKNLKQIFRELKVKGDISEQDQNYWNNLIDQSGGSAQGTLQLLNSLRSLIK